MAALFDMVRDVNKLELSPADADRVLAQLARFDHVMGVLGEEEPQVLDAEVEELIRMREEARKKEP